MADNDITDQLDSIREDIEEIFSLSKNKKKNTLTTPKTTGIKDGNKLTLINDLKKPPALFNPLVKSLQENIRKFDPSAYLTSAIDEIATAQGEIVDDIFTSLFGKPIKKNPPDEKPLNTK